MATNAKNDISKITKRISALLNASISQSQMKAMATEAIDIIKIRTRLGYGAPLGKPGNRFTMPKLSDGYKKYRASSSVSQYLSQWTSAGRSNVTLSGQVLDSMKILTIKPGQVIVGPSGIRKGPFSPGVSNAAIAGYLADQGRTFNNLTIPEVKQMIRFFRVNFGDLKRRQRL